MNQNAIRDAIGILFALGGAVTGALAVVYSKMTSDYIHNSVVTTWYTFANIILCPIWSFFQQRTVLPIYQPGLVCYIFGIGFAFFLVQSLMVYSFQFINASMAGVLIYIAVPCGYILDYFFNN